MSEVIAQEGVKKKSGIFSIGLAMFAMFFGAGNIVFPLALGQATLDKNLYGVLGMVITAVLVPLSGLLAMMLFNGDYNAFFRRIGKLPGFLVILVILAVIGPFGGIPRCITISYSTLNTLGLDKFSFLNLTTFSIISCLAIFLFTYRQSKIVSLIGYVLTPLLLFSLAIIVIKGALHTKEVATTSKTPLEIFNYGLIGGYHTMDLLASFFFSSVVLVCLKKGKEEKTFKEQKYLQGAILGSLIAASLLALVYVCFSYLAAGHSKTLEGIPSHQLLGTLAYLYLGPYAGMIAGAVVAFACLTTEIALAAILADYLRKVVCSEKISYGISLSIILALSFLVSTLHFEGISRFLSPILQICYPALIVLTLLNLAYKLYGFKPVKVIFYATFTLSLALYFFL